MKIMGVDIGSRKLAVSIADVEFVSSDVQYITGIRFNERIEAEGEPMPEVWGDLMGWFRRRLRVDIPERVFVEEPPFVQNRRVLMHLAGTYGMVCATANHYGAEVMGVPVSDWKKIVVGKGNASKDDVRSAMAEEYDIGSGLNLSSLSQDCVDALALLHYGVITTHKEGLLSASV